MPKGIKGFQKGHKFFKGGEHCWFKKRQHYSPKTEFKKGLIPWDKGIKRKDISGANHYLWKGGRIKNMDGYIYIFKPEHPLSNNNGYIFEHRLIMEKSLKRYLKPKEQVHHINGNHSDNHIENLMLFSSNSEHRKYHSPPRNKKGQFIKGISAGFKTHNLSP